MALVEIQVPDIGDFDEVTVIELLVKPGDTVAAEQSLITVHFSICSCIFFTRSSSFSDVRFSRILSTLIGKQNGVSRLGKVMMILLF